MMMMRRRNGNAPDGNQFGNLAVAGIVKERSYERWTFAETQERSQERSFTKFSSRVQRSSIARH